MYYHFLESKSNYSLINIISHNGSRSILSIKCNLDNCIWNPSYTQFVRGRSNCPRCSGSEVLSDAMVIERLDEVTKHTNISYEILSINGSKTSLKATCDIHNYTWNSNYRKLYLSKSGCPLCGGNVKLSDSVVFDRINELSKSKGYTIINIVYNGYYSNIKLNCNKHGSWMTSYDNFYTSKTNCPRCSQEENESKPVKDITRILIENNVDFIKEHTFDECRNQRKLPFDFYLPKYNQIIEYDGIHHFKSIKFWGGDDGLIQTQTNDEIKNNFCANNNINLLRIKYDENHIEKIKNLLYNLKGCDDEI